MNAKATVLTEIFDMDDVPPADVEALANRLEEWFEPSRLYCVAFSGGVDSSVVAVAASRSGAPSIAVTSRSPSVRHQDIQDAERIASELGLAHHWLDTEELLDQQYLRNDSQRCYFCKSHLYSAIAMRYPDHRIVSGTNLDDLKDYRPGLHAADEHSVHAPLVELGIGKLQVRRLADYWSIPVANKPASPCLASRIAYGVPVTAEKLEMIQSAESFLQELMGLSDCRVRYHADSLARIEVDPDNFAQLISNGIRQKIVDELLSLGFHFVTFDLMGQRSGSLNALLPVEAIRIRNNGQRITGAESQSH